VSEIIYLSTPLKYTDINALKVGDIVRLNGIIYTGRDAAHKRLVALLDQGKDLPFDIKGQVIYYVGPSPNKPGKVIGSCGPTTACRMDTYAPKLLKNGLCGMIGKGKRSQKVKDAIKLTGSVYFAAIGGAGALIAKSIKSMELVAYEDIGSGAICRLEVENFPVIVANDMHGGDLYEDGMMKYSKQQ